MALNFHHIAVQVDDISAMTEWYKCNLGAEVVSQFDDWAMLNVGGINLSLTLDNHPSHIAFKCKSELELENFVDLDNQVKVHRDGSSYIYLVDPYGNALEWVYYP